MAVSLEPGRNMERMRTDSEIEQWVLRELGLANDLGSPEIWVQSHDGVVTLNGSVPNYANRLAAQRAAYRVTGIADVVNEIKVKPHSIENRQRSTSVTLSEPFQPSALLPPPRSEDPVGKAATP